MVQASLKRYFLTGLLVMIPIWGTILILKTLFVSLDGILGDAARLVTPGYYVPGLGIIAPSCSFYDRPVRREFHRSPGRAAVGAGSIVCRWCAGSIPPQVDDGHSVVRGA